MAYKNKKSKAKEKLSEAELGDYVPLNNSEISEFSEEFSYYNMHNNNNEKFPHGGSLNYRKKHNTTSVKI